MQRRHPHIKRLPARSVRRGGECGVQRRFGCPMNPSASTNPNQKELQQFRPDHPLASRDACCGAGVSPPRIQKTSPQSKRTHTRASRVAVPTPLSTKGGPVFPFGSVPNSQQHFAPTSDLKMNFSRSFSRFLRRINDLFAAKRDQFRPKITQITRYLDSTPTIIKSPISNLAKDLADT